MPAKPITSQDSANTVTPTAHAKRAPNARFVAASQTTSGQRKNFAASVIPMLADDAKS